MKRIIAFVCVAVLAAAVVTGCSASPLNGINIPQPNNTPTEAAQTPEVTEAPVATDAPAQTQEATEAAIPDANVDISGTSADGIDVTGTAFFSEYSNKLFLFFTNKSGADCDIDVNVDFFDKDGGIVGTTTGYVDAFANGTTVCESFYCDDPFAKVEYKVSASELSYYLPVDKDLSLEVNTASNKAIISVTNNGKIVAKYVEYNVFFYKDGKIVETDWGYCDDSDSEIKVGDTVRDEAHCYEDFDDVKVFIHGEAYKED